MSDHVSGPRAIADPVSDITDVFAFPCPESLQHLVLIMNVFPFAGPSALFSDAIIYRIRVRPVAVASIGHAASFAVGADEVAFDFTFDVPASPGGGTQLVQQGRCTTPNGEVIPLRVNDEKGARGEGVHVFVGQRSDPFFLDGDMARKTMATRQIAFKKVGHDLLYGKNVLGIVLEIEWAKLLKGGPIFAVVGETLTAGKRQIRLERVGRPEIKNVTLSAKTFDQVNRDLEIRDLYNDQDAFKLSEDYVGTIRARLNANLAFYDGLDGKTDWPLDEHGNHPLTALLLADFLIVDASKPYSEADYFGIEQAMLEGRAHATCGGRWLNQDMFDFIFSLYINAGNGPRISDGVEGPITWSTQAFPYMAPPNLPASGPR
jgi:Domain of unknown function (DUF4331)